MQKKLYISKHNRRYIRKVEVYADRHGLTFIDALCFMVAEFFNEEWCDSKTARVKDHRNAD